MARNALLSVYDKTGIEDFAKALIEQGFTVYASGGTAKKLEEANIPVTDVAGLVGGGAILNHKVVTLSREIHAGLLANYDGDEKAEMESLGLPYLDLVCVNLYPLKAEIAKPDSTFESVIKQTDIGGPTMLRSAAKGGRIVVINKNDYQEVLDWLQAGEPDGPQFRNKLAAKAEYLVSDYTRASANYRSDGEYDGFLGRRVLTAKYGENAPQTPAALFSGDSGDALAVDKFKVVAGTDPSYNNLVDIDRLLQTVTHIAAGFDKNFGQVPLIAVGVKHGNACGAAVGDDPLEVITHMYKGDTRAIFGGLVMTTFTITEAVAAKLSELGAKLDGIIAPAVDEAAIKLLERKGDKCRFIINPTLSSLGQASLDTQPRFRYVRGGFVQQPNYTYVADLKDSELVATGEATDQQQRDLIMAWAIGSTSNSNTITLVKNGHLIGNGVGQQDRVGCCELAIKRATDAGHKLEGAAAFSDSFFPFPDGPEVLADAGITAILATSGSVKDGATQELCRERGVALLQVPDSKGRGFFGH